LKTSITTRNRYIVDGQPIRSIQDDNDGTTP
jgi:hypothetical protein